MFYPTRIRPFRCHSHAGLTGSRTRLGEFADDPLHEYLSDIFTLSANLAGIPGISVPAGAVTPPDAPDAKLPVGLQILAPHLAEAKMLRIARSAESGQ